MFCSGSELYCIVKDDTAEQILNYINSHTSGPYILVSQFAKL